MVHRLLFCLAAAAAFLGLTRNAPAVSINWTGTGGNANWDNTGNWSTGTIPGATDDVVFPSTGTYTSGVSLNSADRVCNSLTFDNAPAFTLSGGTFTLSLTSGAITRTATSGTAEPTISANLNLLPASGTVPWSINGSLRTADVSNLRFTGTVTRSVPLQITGSLAGTSTVGFYSAGATGVGDLYIGNNGNAVFGVQQTVANKIYVTGTGNKGITAYNAATTLSGGIDIAAGNKLYFGWHNNSQHLLILNAPTTGAGDIDLFRGGLAVNNLNQLTTGNLYIGEANGALILDGISWAALMANRSGAWGATANKFQIGNQARFGARTAPLLIQNSGIDVSGINTNTYFDRNFGLGASYEKDGAIYANQPVTLDTDTRFTGLRDIQISGAGPGLNGAHGSGLVHTITADLTDGGAGARGGVRIVGGGNYASEVILAGANTWTGSSGTDAATIVSTVSRHFCGLGGLMTTGNNLSLLATFASPASLPTGNAGGKAYLSSFNRSGGMSGYLVTAATGGATYDTAPNLNWAFGSNIVAVFGSTGLAGQSATLAGSDVLIHSDLVGGPQNLSLEVRGGLLELGATANPLRFQPVTGNDTQATALATSQPATTYTDATGTRTLLKRGTGTLVLENIAYTKVDGTGDTSSQFVWQIGSGTNTVYDGAVRVAPIGTGTNANSLENFNVQLIGGVLESSGTFNRTLGTGTTQVQWPNNTAGGGFSAYGGDLTVDLNAVGADTFTWASTALFARDAAPLIFGSSTANATVRWVDNINLNGAARTVWVMRGTGTAPEANIMGVLSNGSVRKIGTGVLAITANNTYAGTTTAAEGTLLVNGTHTGGGSYTVSAGATLGGTGIIDPSAGNTVTVTGAAGNYATLAPGASIGTLTVGSAGSPNNVVMGDNSTMAGEVAFDGSSDRLVVVGTFDLSSALNRLTITGTAPAAGQWYTIASYTALTGTFEQILWGDGIKFEAINYAYGGNNIAVMVVPEPSVLALLAFATAGCFLRRRRG